MIQTEKQARDKRRGLKDAHTKQLYEEPKLRFFGLQAGDVLAASGEPQAVDLPKVNF